MESMESKININGINIAVKQAGTGPDMILIHGIFATKEIMNPLFNQSNEKKFRNPHPL